MAAYKVSEREIFKIEVDGVELRFDPIRCILRYNKAVAEAGGVAEYTMRWKRYHRDKLPLLAKDATEEQKAERMQLVNTLEIQDADDCIYLGTIGAKTLDMPLFDPANHEDGKPQLMVKQARDVVYRYVEYMTKKESGEETSTLPSKPDSPPSDATGEAGQSTPTS